MQCRRRYAFHVVCYAVRHGSTVRAIVAEGSTFLSNFPVQVTCYTTVYQVLKVNSVESDVVGSYICMISGLCRVVDEICALLGFHATWNPKRAQISG